MIQSSGFRNTISFGRVIFMEMESVKLSIIVERLTPELFEFLKPEELNARIVLRDGIQKLNANDALEIIQYSIYQNQKDAFLH